MIQYIKIYGAIISMTPLKGVGLKQSKGEKYDERT